MTIGYQLARSLKDAGFPQKYGLYYTPGNPGYIETDGPRNEDSAFIPTLEELIKVYDGHFTLQSSQQGWEAFEGKVCGKGSTPEEAVGNLVLLSLNKKHEKRTI